MFGFRGDQRLRLFLRKNNMEKPHITWQGIGISSNPFQSKEPLSLHLQTYLQESANSADKHLIVIADEMQVPNYISMYGLSESKARRISVKRGKRRQKEIQRILNARGIKNTEVVRFDDILSQEQMAVLKDLRELYRTNEEVRNKILSCVPKRLLERANNRDQITDYALTEMGLILSMGGVKFGGEREKVYDNIALEIHNRFGIGLKPRFLYSRTPLEVIPDKSLKVEPYSAISSVKRLLLTDSLEDVQEKLSGLEGKMQKVVRTQLENAGLLPGENMDSFYSRVIKSTKYALEAPKRMWRNLIASSAMGLSALLLTGIYVDNDANNIKRSNMNNLTIFALNGDVATCEKAINYEIRRTNVEVKDKYNIPNYFKTFKS